MSSRIWPVNLQYPTTGLGISRKILNLNFKKKRKTIKTSYLEIKSPEQPYVAARFATPSNSLAASNYRDENFEFEQKKANLGFLDFFEKIAKKCRIAKTTKN